MPFNKNKFDAQFKAAIQEHLQRMNTELLQLEQNADNEQLIESLLRATHSIKSTAKMMSYPGIPDIAHALEDAFLNMKSRGAKLSVVHINICLRCLDTISVLLDKRIEFNEILIQDLCLSIKKTFEKNLDDKAISLKPVPICPSTIDTIIRVDIEKLGKVLTIAGEQIIIKNRLQDLISQCTGISLDEAKDNQTLENVCMQLEDASRVLDTLVVSMYAEIMDMRMLPINHLFQHFTRTMRDLALEKSKEVVFETYGAETKIDKAILDELQIPLIHILRNAIDHGIESGEERMLAHKDSKGKITLRAWQQKSYIIIEISDDGRGIDVARLKQKALAQGIIRQETSDEMIDEQALQLIFCPGLSTKDTVSDISGRGVGLDVVREKVLKLKGIIEVSSIVNKGTRFTLKIPATLSLRDAIFVTCAGQQFAVLADAVCGTIRLIDSEIRVVNGKEEIKHKEYIVPLIRLGNLLGLRGIDTKESVSSFAIVVKSVDTQIALAVDEILENREIVVKNLKSFLEQAPFISGATISDDGKIVLVLDIPEIVNNNTKFN